MSSVSSVVFDIGNVLVDWSPSYLYNKIIPDEGERAVFLKDIANMDWHKEQDRGRPMKQGVAALANRYPEYAEWIEAWDLRWDEMITGAIDGTVAILEDLVAAGIPTFAITNFPADKFVDFRQQYAFTSLFNDIVVSGEEKLIKPDPRIFHVALDRFDLDPEQAVFIDDRLDNVTAAEQLNMTGHHFTSPEPLRLHLQCLGLL